MANRKRQVIGRKVERERENEHWLDGSDFATGCCAKLTKLVDCSIDSSASYERGAAAAAVINQMAAFDLLFVGFIFARRCNQALSDESAPLREPPRHVCFSMKPSNQITGNSWLCVC